MVRGGGAGPGRGLVLTLPWGGLWSAKRDSRVIESLPGEPKSQGSPAALIYGVGEGGRESGRERSSF